MRAIVLPATTAAIEARPMARAPKRSIARPPGSWTRKWTPKSAVVSNPTAASETLYVSASVPATAPTLETFQVTPPPRASPAATAVGRLCVGRGPGDRLCREPVEGLHRELE